MPLSAILLFAATVLIWGSTWLAITFQLGEVEPLVSVVYRFSLSAILLFCWCLLRGAPLRLTPRQHGFMLIQGLCMFGLNYWLVYLAQGYLPSGVVAVIFSSLLFMNIINGRLFAGRRASGLVMFGGALGMCGVLLLFLPELDRFSLNDNALKGLLLGFTSTMFASIGNIVAMRNSGFGLPVISVNAWGMLYGSTALTIIAVLRGDAFQYSATAAYTLSLLYLAVFGSVIAFGCYLRLLAQIGPERAAYNAMLFPVVALLLSTVFEGYQWTLPAIAGLALIAVGNVLVLRRRASGSEVKG